MRSVHLLISEFRVESETAGRDIDQQLVASLRASLTNYRAIVAVWSCPLRIANACYAILFRFRTRGAKSRRTVSRRYSRQGTEATNRAVSCANNALPA